MTDRPCTVRELDPGDEATLERWWEIGHAASLERPVDLWMTWDEARVAVPLGPVEREMHLLGAFVDDDGADDGGGERMVGAGRIDLPLNDNTHLAFGDLWVAPDARGRGVGTALLGFVEQVARRGGRDTVLLDAHAPAAGGSSPGQAFLERHGFAVAGVEVSKVADLRATRDRWAALEQRAAERLAPYELLWFADRVPDEHAPDVAAMFSRFLGEIPLGEVDLRPERWDVDRLRRIEARREGSGGRYLMVAARSPASELVGYTDVGWRRTNPRVAHIHSTLVLPGHRGHRLGLAMKVRLHRLTLEQLPAVELIATGNADVNAHMNAVNEELGYRPVDRVLEMQKVL